MDDHPLPEYNAGQRVGPPNRQSDQLIEEAKSKNLMWILSRLHCEKQQSVSSWTGFKTLVHDKEEIIPNQVSYLPTVNAPATKLSTV